MLTVYASDALGLYMYWSLGLGLMLEAWCGCAVGGDSACGLGPGGSGGGWAAAARGARGTREDRQGSKTGSKRATVSGYGERRTAIKAAGRATSSHIVPQAEFIWHARGQGFESPKLNVV